MSFKLFAALCMINVSLLGMVRPDLEELRQRHANPENQDSKFIRCVKIAYNHWDNNPRLRIGSYIFTIGSLTCLDAALELRQRGFECRTAGICAGLPQMASSVLRYVCGACMVAGGSTCCGDSCCELFRKLKED